MTSADLIETEIEALSDLRKEMTQTEAQLHSLIDKLKIVANELESLTLKLTPQAEPDIGAVLARALIPKPSPTETARELSERLGVPLADCDDGETF